jgi:non-specific serine/threonine protein kinase
MGLGKTIQVLALLLRIKNFGEKKASLLVVPASLIANWKDEIAKFAPGLSFSVVHPSENSQYGNSSVPFEIKETDLVITTYGMLTRNPWMSEHEWKILIIDEAQAIKNPDTQQTKTVKKVQGKHKIALTGTPVENRLGDLWSIFDFINPGLLGGAKQFAKYAKGLIENGSSGFSSLRFLTRPYIMRRLKTDKNVIPDLPGKTEMIVYCGLTKKQALLYSAAVKELVEKLERVDGIARKGAVLSAIMKFKQICNHPSHFSGDGIWSRDDSGKMARLSELFRNPRLSMHGGTPVKERQKIVGHFQREDGPPFLILTVKVGGTGLNLTAASHVIHFDRWWNTTVKNQATDRAFRIGQKKTYLSTNSCAEER